MYQNIIKVSEKNTENIAILIQSILKKQVDLTASISANTNIHELLTNKHLKSEQVFLGIKRNILNNDAYMASQYPFTYIISDAEGNMFTNFSYSPYQQCKLIYSSLAKETWFIDLSSSYFPYSCIIRRNNLLITKGSDQLYFAQNIIDDGINIGVVITGIDAFYIEDLMSFNQIDSFLLSLTNELLANGSKNTNITYKSDILEILKSDVDSLRRTIVINNKKFLASKHILKLSYGNSANLFTIERKQKLLSEITKINIFSILMVLLNISGLSLVMLLFSKHILKPIESMYLGMKTVREGNLDLKLNFNSNDEIGELAIGFNEMTAKIKQNIIEIKEVENEKRSLEIKALYSQMSPHFVRNILNSIRWMAELSGSEGISSAILALSDMLEYNFRNKETLTTVRDEVNYLSKYVFMQQIRYQNRFKVCYAIDENILDYKILKLIFQPIVENSIVHGILPKKGISTITIKGYVSENRLIFCIIDDGLGIKPLTLSNILNPDTSESNSEHRIALSNIEKRIKLNFGPTYGITIESTLGKGTIVYVALPIIRGDENESTNC